MAGKLIDKVAIVTGASSGIGEATALALAVEGATVVIAARRSDRLQDLEARITGTGGKALSITADVSDEEQVEALVNQTHAKFGRVDILINNAGVMLLGLIDGADTEDWRLADKLVKVYRTGGEESWIMVHIEVQSQNQIKQVLKKL